MEVDSGEEVTVEHMKTPPATAHASHHGVPGVARPRHAQKLTGDTDGPRPTSSVAEKTRLSLSAGSAADAGLGVVQAVDAGG
ncbi:hypothetical protein GOC74_07960 [Halomicrobium mukohataei]|uniref:Uncharacterized protein n=1 Tax=Halomicrobium mukohataei TaxID=57705 RepID=A0A847UEK6_9EURY|nr:hypothetical protein [Halomicrobium mukohataei]NLV09864.1 hypothetical protein [Halomicrobium mukohataei]